MPFLSPLRYPGGKRKLTDFVKLILDQNQLINGCYVEPFAGGASIALSLLFDDYVSKVYLNDLDQSIYAFWYCVLNETENLCRLIKDTPVTIEQWKAQKEIQRSLNLPMLVLGFSTFFLNRTNRSGIISGGVIGGKNQTGSWKLDARYNKSDLIRRIERIAAYKNRINISNFDAGDFLENTIPILPFETLIFLDPPYYVKGQQLLYTNYYEPNDHIRLSELVKKIKQCCMISYDDVSEIREIYKNYKFKSYFLYYSAQDRYQGQELIIFSENMKIPQVINPANLKNSLRK